MTFAPDDRIRHEMFEVRNLEFDDEQEVTGKDESIQKLDLKHDTRLTD